MEEPQLILCVCLKCILLHGVLCNLTTNKDAAAYCCATIKDSTARTLVFRVFSMDTSGSTYYYGCNCVVVICNIISYVGFIIFSWIIIIIRQFHDFLIYLENIKKIFLFCFAYHFNYKTLWYGTNVCVLKWLTDYLVWTSYIQLISNSANNLPFIDPS